MFIIESSTQIITKTFFWLNFFFFWFVQLFSFCIKRLITFAKQVQSSSSNQEKYFGKATFDRIWFLFIQLICNKISLALWWVTRTNQACYASFKSSIFCHLARFSVFCYFYLITFNWKNLIKIWIKKLTWKKNYNQAKLLYKIGFSILRKWRSVCEMN